MARGDMTLAAQSGESIPPDAAIDQHGQKTSDPSAGLKGALLPMAGHKGTCLALMVELLAASFTGDAYAFEAAATSGGDTLPTQHGEVILAIDPERCSAGGGREAFLQRVEALFDMVQAEAKEAEAAGGSLRLPSQRRWANRKRAMEEGFEGFEVSEALMSQCVALGE
ncbi:unnamed protein product [Effrenium voratum]|nr:unnamed protein product [Effrenium voratum]